ncbi:MAG: helix-turn-helix transcriptional regulator [Anaerotignaceae bacterium]
MIQRTEREVMNNEIAEMLKSGMPYKEISAKLGISINRVSELAQKMGLGRKLTISPAELRQIPNGNTLEDIRKANPFEIGERVIIKDKNRADATKSYKCTVEKVTDSIVFARGENGRMYTASFAAIGMDSNLIRKVG